VFALGWVRKNAPVSYRSKRKTCQGKRLARRPEWVSRQRDLASGSGLAQSQAFATGLLSCGLSGVLQSQSDRPTVYRMAGHPIVPSCAGCCIQVICEIEGCTDFRPAASKCLYFFSTERMGYMQSPTSRNPSLALDACMYPVIRVDKQAFPLLFVPQQLLSASSHVINI
jgi:hypothetical protein